MEFHHCSLQFHVSFSALLPHTNTRLGVTVINTLQEEEEENYLASWQWMCRAFLQLSFRNTD